MDGWVGVPAPGWVGVLAPGWVGLAASETGAGTIPRRRGGSARVQGWLSSGALPLPLPLPQPSTPVLPLRQQLAQHALHAQPQRVGKDARSGGVVDGCGAYARSSMAAGRKHTQVSPRFIGCLPMAGGGTEARTHPQGIASCNASRPWAAALPPPLPERAPAHQLQHPDRRHAQRWPMCFHRSPNSTTTRSTSSCIMSGTHTCSRHSTSAGGGGGAAQRWREEGRRAANQWQQQ